VEPVPYKAMVKCSAEGGEAKPQPVGATCVK